MRKRTSETLKAKGIRPRMIMNWTGIKRGKSPLKGRIRPEAIVNKIAESNRGKIVSEDARKRISESLLGRYHGENSPHWIKDRSKIKGRHERTYHDSDYKIWRRKVYERDGFICKINNSDCKGKIEAHHILPWRSFVELRYDLNNGITLCHAHHPRKESEENRLSSYFKKLIGIDKLN